jgi:hypothetical protein
MLILAQQSFDGISGYEEVREPLRVQANPVNIGAQPLVVVADRISG